MDVELQILKHLARDAHPTVALIDEYCAEYKDLFKEVRNYECFKYLHLGMMSPIKRKSLPEIAKVVSIKYGFRQCKQELGWTDYRFTNFQYIERWWEIIFCERHL